MKKILAALLIACVSLAHAQTFVRQGGAIYNAASGAYVGHINLNTGKEELLTATLGSGLTATAVICTDSAKALTSTCSSATPSFAATTVTTLNKVTITAPATGSTLTITDGKVLTASNTLTLAGTDSTVMTFPTTSATIARTDAANTFTGTQTFSGATALNGGVTSTGAGTVFSAPSGGTNAIIFDLINTSGRAYFGIDNSAGGAFSGSSAYAAFFGNIGNNKLQFATNNTVRGEFAADGTLLLKQGLARTYLANSSASYSVGVNDTNITTNVAGTTTLTLPAAATYPGREIVVRTITAQTTISASSNVVPCVGGSAGTAILAATAGKWAVLVSDGSNWQIQMCN